MQGLRQSSSSLPPLLPAADRLLFVVAVILSISSMPGGLGSGVKEGTVRGPYKKTAGKRKAKVVRETAKAADEADKRQRMEAAEQKKAAAKERRQQQGCARVADSLRGRGPVAASSSAVAAAAAPAAAAEPKGSIAAFFMPQSVQP